MAYTQVAVTGTVLLSNGVAAQNASVSFTLNTAITDGSSIVNPEQLTAVTNSSGLFSITLNANDDVTTLPLGTYYKVMISWQEQTVSSFNVIVPHASAPTVNLFTLATLPNPNVQTPYVSQIVAAGTGVTLSPTGGTGVVTISGGDKAWLDVPSTWGQFWTPAKAAAKAGTGLARLAIVGDSIGQLFDASSHANSWAGLLTTALQGSYGDGGSGFMGPANTRIYATGEFAGGYTEAQLGITVAGTGTWASDQAELGASGDGPGAVDLFAHTGIAGSSTCTWTQTVRGNSLTLYYNLVGTGAGITGGTITWTIDGVAQTSINTMGVQASTAITPVTVTGLGSGSHTVVLTMTSAGSNFTTLFGLRGFNSTGVVVDNYSRSGALAQSFTVQGHAGYGLPAAYSGGQSLPSDLLIYSLGVNDAHQNTAVETYIDAVATHLTQIRDAGAMNGATDLLFLMPHVGRWEGASKFWHDYMIRMRSLAQTYNAALVDVWSYFRNSYAYAQSLNYFSNGHTGTGTAGSDTVHPGDTGHSLIYGLLQQVPGLV